MVGEQEVTSVRRISPRQNGCTDTPRIVRVRGLIGLTAPLRVVVVATAATLGTDSMPAMEVKSVLVLMEQNAA